MENIIGCYKNDGEEIDIKNIDKADYLKILLKGKHATKKSAYALISKENINLVLDFDWFLGKDNYPITFGSKTNKKIRFGRGRKMHQILFRLKGIKVKKPNVIDHINHDRLDNRIENLRICTQKENSYNTSKRNDKYKGVRKGANNTYIAQISKDGTKYEIKNIKTELEAAKIYDAMADELFGDYAGKNFKD